MRLSIKWLFFLFILIFPILFFFVAPVSSYTPVTVDEDWFSDGLKIKYEIIPRVNSVDFSKKTASIHFSITAQCSDSNVSQIGINFYGNSLSYIMCQRYGDYFLGDKTVENWALDGVGEAYPFDTYSAEIRVSDQFYIVKNGSLTTEYPTATFDTSFLQSYDNVLIKNRDLFEFENAVFVINMHRDSSVEPTQLMLPIMFSFFVLGFSILLDHDKIAERLSVYLAIFIFSPTFMFAIQNLLPDRSNLAIPEILIVSLLSTTAFLAISTMIPYKKYEKYMDATFIAFAMVLLGCLYQPVLLAQFTFTTIGLLFLSELGIASGVLITLVHFALKHRKQKGYYQKKLFK